MTPLTTQQIAALRANDAPEFRRQVALAMGWKIDLKFSFHRGHDTHGTFRCIPRYDLDPAADHACLVWARENLVEEQWERFLTALPNGNHLGNFLKSYKSGDYAASLLVAVSFPPTISKENPK